MARGKGLTKTSFIRYYTTLTPEDREKLKTYLNDVLKYSLFLESFDFAEKRLLWIREIEEKEKM